MEKRDAIKWVNALRSGKYKQSTGSLQNEHGYCCLGVACKIFNKENVLDRNGFLFGATGASQPKSPQWLQTINHEFYIRFNICLVSLNDSSIEEMPDQRFTFDEIADIIQAVYIEPNTF